MKTKLSIAALALTLPALTSTLCGQELIVSNLQPGTIARLEVTGASPGGRVAFGYSLTGGGPTTIQAGLCGTLSIALSLPLGKKQALYSTADSQGQAFAQLPVPQGSAGQPIWFQALDLSVCSLTNGVAGTIGNGPAITDVRPRSAPVGQPVTLDGVGFGSATTPDDICVGNFANGVFGDATAVQPDQIQFEVTSLGPTPRAGPIIAMVGRGTTSIIQSPVPGVTFTEPGWAWDSVGPAGPDNTSTSPVDFNPIADSASTNCGTERKIAYWTLDNGEAVLAVPRIKTGYLVDLRFDLCTTSRSRKDFRMYKIDVCTSSQASLISGLLLALNETLARNGMTDCTAYSLPFSSEIRLQCNSDPITCIWSGIDAYPDPNKRTTDLGGVEDNFTLPAEPASPDVANGFAGSLFAPRDFDVVAANGDFGHTLSGFGTGRVDAAFLEIHLRAHADDPTNDSISLEFDGTSGFHWSSRISDLPEAGGSWISGTTRKFCLCLSELPISGGTVDILSELADGKLDVRVADDTAVDYMTLRIYRCP